MRRLPKGGSNRKEEGRAGPYMHFGNKEHSGHTRGVGVVPWKNAFEDDRTKYRSRSRVAAERAAEEQRRVEQIVDKVKTFMSSDFEWKIEQIVMVGMGIGRASHDMTSDSCDTQGWAVAVDRPRLMRMKATAMYPVDFQWTVSMNPLPASCMGPKSTSLLRWR
jgi:hypothetical protein